MSENEKKAELEKVNQEIEAELLTYLEEQEEAKDIEPESNRTFYLIVAVVLLIITTYKLLPLISKYLSS